MGNILLQGESLKTEYLPEEQCNSAICDFCDMHECATNAEDKFFAEEGLYGDNDAPIYRYFSDWQTFISKEYSKGVSLTTYNRLQSLFKQNPNLDTVKDKEEFNQLEAPKALGGIRMPVMDEGMLVDIPSWKVWRERWYCEHQEQVIWNDWNNQYFVNTNLNCDILWSEIRGFIANKKDIPSSECKDDLIHEIILSEKKCHIDEDINKPLVENAPTVYFHRIVMSSYARGGNRQGYLTDVGGRICKSNYYIELPILAAMEKEAAPAGRDNTQRDIWGIKNANGQWKFISFDFEKGMFEFHNDSGSHQGEFMFDGFKNANAQDNHSLKCVDAWKERFSL